jgi:hypothetical protein
MAAPRRNLTASAIVASPILFVIALAIAIVALRNLVLHAGNADLLDLAASLENGSPRPDGDYLARFVQTHGLERVAADCGNSFTRASITVTLAALDAAIEQNDVALIDAAEQNALRAAEHRLRCNPLDGNAWLRAAAVNMRGEGPVASVVDELRLSYWSAPSESWIIEPRLAFATNLTMAGVTGFENEYLGDLRRFASYEPTNLVASSYVDTPPQIRARLHPLIDAQPDLRKKAIIAEIDRLGVDFTRQ